MRVTGFNKVLSTFVVLEKCFYNVICKIMEKSKDQKATSAFKVKGDWKSQSKQLRSKYPKLTNDDLKFELGKENALLKRVESRLGKNYNEVVKIMLSVQPAQTLSL